MNKMISLTTIWILTAGMFGLAAQVPQADQKLIITLNKDVVVDESRVYLRQIAALSGPVELVQKTQNLEMGMFSVKGQVLQADQNTVLSRLASTGISLSQVQLLGAKIVEIRRNEKTVEPQQIIQTAQTYIEKQLEGQKVCFLQVIGSPSSVVLNDPNAPAQLSALMNRYQTPGAKKVIVTVVQNGVPIAQQEVQFAVRFWSHRAVALRDLLPQTVIQKEDVTIEQIESSIPDPAEWKEPFGLAVRRRISKGSAIHPDWLGSVEAPVLIKRNQPVLVQLDTGSMFLSATGQALDEGRAGELIRVKRGQKPDERIIYCMIRADGTVRPQI
jgi:flagella basal body P-ring formation protein FlgA